MSTFVFFIVQTGLLVHTTVLANSLLCFELRFHHPFHSLLVNYCQLFIIDPLASLYIYIYIYIYIYTFFILYLVVQVLRSVPVLISVSCFCTCGFFWILKIKLQIDLFVWAFRDQNSLYVLKVHMLRESGIFSSRERDYRLFQYINI